MLYPGQPTVSWPPNVSPKWSKTVTGDDLIVDLATIKAFLHRPIEDGFWDRQLLEFAATAQSELERVMRMSLVNTTWAGTLPTFYQQIRLNKRPFISVTNVSYVDPNTGAVTTVDPTTYQALPIQQLCGMLFIGDGYDWPTPATRMDAVRFTVTTGPAGFEDGELPQAIQHALLMTVAAIDNSRGDQGSGGGHTTVYAMKMASGGGGSFLPHEARALVSDYIMRVL